MSMLYKFLLFIIFSMFFIFPVQAEIMDMVVYQENNTAIAENNIFKIDIDYATNGVSYATLTSKTYTGDIDFAVGYNSEEIFGIDKIELYKPHPVYNLQSRIIYNVTGFTLHDGTGQLDVGEYNDRNQMYYTIDTSQGSLICGFYSTTFTPPLVVGDNYSIYWYTERIEDYVNLGNFGEIDRNYDGKDTWMITQSRSVEAGQSYKLKITGNIPIRQGKCGYKYDFALKPSSQTLQEAISSGHLYVIDPYWNTSFSSRKNITITTNGTSTPADYQVLLNITYESEMQSDFDDIRFTNSTNGELGYWIESYVSSSYALVWVNLSDPITDPGSDTIWMYYGNDAVSSDSDGYLTFGVFDDFNDGVVTGWTVPASTSASESGGILSMSATDVNYARTIYRSYSGDGIIESKVKMTSLYYMGLTFKGTTDINFYSFRFYPDGSINLYEEPSVQLIDHDPVSLLPNTDYLFVLSMEGANFVGNVYSSDRNTLEATVSGTDASLNGARVGIGGYNGNIFSDWFFIRKYIANEPTISYGSAEYYVDSLHYNATVNYNHTIESDGTITANHTVYAVDDTNWTANSTGDTYWTFTTAVTPAGYTNFTLSGDNLDNFTVTNLTASTECNLINSSGTVETQTTDINGTAMFEVDLVPGDYWIELKIISIDITLLSQTPDKLYQNSSGTITQVWGINHSEPINQISIAYTFGMYDVIDHIYKFNLRTPSNNIADLCPYCGMDILRGYNRNQTLTWESNATITGGDIYTWNGYDYYNSEITFQVVNATYTNVTVSGLVRNQVFPVSTYLDASDLKEAPKTVFPIHKTSGLVIKIWDNEAFLDHEHLGFAYVDAIITGTLPLDAAPIEIFYLNESFDTAGAVHPDDSPYLFYLTSMNASEWATNDYSPHANSSYVNSIVVNSTAIENSGIDVEGEAYLYFRSSTPSARPYGVNMTNVASSTNVSFADSKTMWKTVDTPFSITVQDYTPNIFTSFMHKNMQYQSKLWIQENSVWYNSSLETTNIEVSIFPPSAPGFDYICFGGANDYDMDNTYFSTIGVGIGVSQDPDGGVVDHNLTLHYGNNGTFVAVINNTFTNEDANGGGFICVEFDTTPYYSDILEYTMKINATDDDDDSVIQWLGVNFRLTDTPTIIDYSPITPVNATEEFNITINQIVNVTWYIDSVKVFNETGVNTSSYNDTLVSGIYNITAYVENVNGSDQHTWVWDIEPENPLIFSLFAALLIMTGCLTVYGLLASDPDNYTHIISSFAASIMWFILGYQVYIGIGFQETRVHMYQEPILAGLMIIAGVIMALYSIIQAVEENKNLIENLEK